jgi:hypothetical protein
MIERRYRVGIALALIVAGVVVAVIGYLGVSKETEVAFQLPYFASAGIGALLLFGAGSALLVAAQLERDDDRIADLEEAVRLLGSDVGQLVDDLSPPRPDGARTVTKTRRSRRAA